MIARKLTTAFAHHLTPVLCVGDTHEEHQAGSSDTVVRDQLAVLLRVYPGDTARFVIAHEPSWAISTGPNAQNCQPEEAGQRHRVLRSLISNELGTQRAANTTLLYGGSVTASNASTYLDQTDIDGSLVGGASQAAASLRALIDATVSSYRNFTSSPTHPTTLDNPAPSPTH